MTNWVLKGGITLAFSQNYVNIDSLFSHDKINSSAEV